MKKKSPVLLAGLFAGLMFAPALALAQAPALPAAYAFHRIAAPDESDAIPLFSDDALPMQSRSTEVWDTMGGLRVVRNVSRPTITPVLPDPSIATGAAVLVIPGGGFKSVAMEGEGWPVAKWLAEHGVAAFVLKYRLNPTPADEQVFMQEIMAGMAGMKGGKVNLTLVDPEATADAVQAMKMVRAGAAKWHIDPARVGVIGFSAGAVAVLDVSLNANSADKPDFSGSIYGPMVSVTVPADAPPLFTALALDDPLFGRQGFGVVDSWRQAKRPVEVHAYERGGHGFGMGTPGTTTTMMLPEFLAWMQSRRLLGPTSQAAPVAR